MTSILALSVSGKIEQYGAYAGFASVLGLAILSLLYFAQARELKRLREWAGRAPERSAELEARVAADAQRRVAAQPVAKPQPQPQPGQPRPVAAPATPAGQAQAAPAAAVAATAAGAAAKTATPGQPAQPPQQPGAQPTTVQPAAAPANGAGPKDGDAAKAPQPVKPGQPLEPPRPSGAPAGAPAAAAGAGAAAGAAGAGAAAARPGQPLRVPSPSATVPPRAGAGAGAGARADGAHDDERRSPGRTTLAIVGAVAVVLIAGIVIATQVIGGGGGGTPHKAAANTIAQSPPSSTTSTPGTTAVDPTNTTVAVLNGTTVPGLARGVANKLQKARFHIGNVTNAADQSRSATLVEYTAGRRREGLAVAKSIGVGPDAVQALDAGTRVIAGEGAQVVAVVGSDQNTQQP